jgi:hypothetical protein
LTILTKKYYEALRRGTADTLVEIIVAEECQNYIRGRRLDEPPNVGERTVYELRSFGVGAVLVCPDPTLLPEAILRDVGTIISMSPDTLPRFALERYLFRASLEEAENTLKRLKKSRMVVYYKNQLHFLRRLPRVPKVLKTRPKGDRMGVTDSGVGSLRAWPILPRRSPGILAPKVIKVKEEVEEKPKVIEVKTEHVEELKLEEELEEETEVMAEKPAKEEKFTAEEEKVEESAVEVKEEIEEKLAEEMSPEPAPKGPPIPSTLPYRGSLCPAGRPHLTPVH